MRPNFKTVVVVAQSIRESLSLLSVRAALGAFSEELLSCSGYYCTSLSLFVRYESHPVRQKLLFRGNESAGTLLDQVVATHTQTPALITSERSGGIPDLGRAETFGYRS